MVTKIRSNVYLDSELKEQAKKLFKSYGLSLSDGINFLLKKTLNEKELDFPVTIEPILPNDSDYEKSKNLYGDYKKNPNNYVSFDKIDWNWCMYQLIFSKKTQKFIEKQDKPTKQRFKNIFIKLSNNPYPNNQELDIKKMTNMSSFRLRVGKYRFIYQVQEEVLIIIVEKGDSRGDVYK